MSPVEICRLRVPLRQYLRVTFGGVPHCVDRIEGTGRPGWVGTQRCTRARGIGCRTLVVMHDVRAPKDGDRYRWPLPCDGLRMKCADALSAPWSGVHEETCAVSPVAPRCRGSQPPSYNELQRYSTHWRTHACGHFLRYQAWLVLLPSPSPWPNGVTNMSRRPRGDFANAAPSADGDSVRHHRTAIPPLVR